MPLLLMPVVLIGLGAAGFWIWMLVDCLNNKQLSGCQRCCWALLILFTHLVGSLIYYCAGRPSQTSVNVPVYQARAQQRREPVQFEGDRPY
jgi:hypothetical protein